LRVREEKIEGVEMWFCCDCMLSIDMKLLAERGDESIELLLEISESERFRLRTIVAIDIFEMGEV
jgi:hypothetical protein